MLILGDILKLHIESPATGHVVYSPVSFNFLPWMCLESLHNFAICLRKAVMPMTVLVGNTLLNVIVFKIEQFPVGLRLKSEREIV